MQRCVALNSITWRVAVAAVAALGLASWGPAPDACAQYSIDVTSMAVTQGSSADVPVYLTRSPGAELHPATLAMSFQYNPNVLDFAGFLPSPLSDQWYGKVTVTGAAPPDTPNADINDDGIEDALDYQLVALAINGFEIPFSADINDDGVVNAVDLQIALNAVLGPPVSSQANLAIFGTGMDALREMTTFDDQRELGNPEQQFNPFFLGTLRFNVVGQPGTNTLITVDRLSAADSFATRVPMESMPGTIVVTSESFVVEFADANLEAVVREAIEKPEGEILHSDLVGTGFTNLDASNRGVTNLSGIEYAFDLQTLDLSSNDITEVAYLTPLQQLTSLELAENRIRNIAAIGFLPNLAYLGLASNLVEDITPLVNNPGLGDGDEMALDFNPLSGDACAGVDLLRSRGVFVSTVGACGNIIRGLLLDSETEQPITCAAIVATPLEFGVKQFDEFGRAVGTTDFNGMFALADLFPGEYLLEFYAPGYANDEAFIFVDDGAITEITKPLTPVTGPPDIAGVVREVDDLGGGVTRGAPPLPGVRVEAFIGEMLAAVSYTCADGRYEIRGLFDFMFKQSPDDPVTVLLEFTSETHETTQATVEATPGETADSSPQVQPKAIGAASVAGTVRAAGSNTPVANARITLSGGANVTAQSGPSGAYGVGALPEGGYTFRVSAQGYEGQSLRRNLAGLAPSQVNFTLTPSGDGSPVDINGDGAVNALDVQLVINAALQIDISPYSADVNNDGVVNAIDIQLVINAVLGVTG